MPAIGHLLRVGSALTNTAGIGFGTIAADDLDTRREGRWHRGHLAERAAFTELGAEPFYRRR